MNTIPEYGTRVRSVQSGVLLSLLSPHVSQDDNHEVFLCTSTLVVADLINPGLPKLSDVAQGCRYTAKSMPEACQPLCEKIFARRKKLALSCPPRIVKFVLRDSRRTTAILPLLISCKPYIYSEKQPVTSKSACDRADGPSRIPTSTSRYIVLQTALKQHA